jgi:hypothetical protein
VQQAAVNVWLSLKCHCLLPLLLLLLLLLQMSFRCLPRLVWACHQCCQQW